MQGAASQIPLFCAGGAPTETYKQYVASPSTSLRIVSLSNERSDRW
jgi:hypothetical protein